MTTVLDPKVSKKAAQYLTEAQKRDCKTAILFDEIMANNAKETT